MKNILLLLIIKIIIIKRYKVLKNLLFGINLVTNIKSFSKFKCFLFLKKVNIQKKIEIIRIFLLLFFQILKGRRKEKELLKQRRQNVIKKSKIVKANIYIKKLFKHFNFTLNKKKIKLNKNYILKRKNIKKNYKKTYLVFEYFKKFENFKLIIDEKFKKRKRYKRLFALKISFFSIFLYRFFKLQNFQTLYKFFNFKRFLVFLNSFFFKIFKYFKYLYFLKEVKYVYIKNIYLIFKRIIFINFVILADKRLTASTLGRYLKFRLYYKATIKSLLKYSFFWRIKKVVTGFRVFAKGRFTRKDRASDLTFGAGRMPGSSSKFGSLEFSYYTVKLKNSTCNLIIKLFKNKLDKNIIRINNKKRT